MSVQLYNPTTDELTQVAGEEFNDTVIRVSALPTATADLINETYLLVADQTGYTRGGIYQCQYVNDAFTWVLVNGSGMTVDAIEDGNMNGVTSNAVADKFATLGTASEKDVTNFVSPTDNGVPISSSVFSAITSALYGAYHPSGSKTIAELDSSLLIQANVGNVYKITDSGVTTNLFIGGAGQTINIGDNAVVVYDSDGETFKYALQSGVVDLSEYQTKELPSGALIEDVIPTNASSSNKLITENDLNAKTNGVPYVTGENYSSTNLNEYLTPCITFINVSSYTNVPSNTSSVAYMLEVKATGNKGSTDLPYVSQILTAYDKSEKFIRSRNPNSGTWSSWQKLIVQSDLNKAITVTTADNNIVIADSRLITNNLVMVSGYIKSGTQLAFNTSQVKIGNLSVSGRTIRGSAPCNLFLFSNDLFETNGPNTIPAIWKTAQGWLTIGRDVTNNPKLSEDAWFTAMIPLQ